MNKPEFYPYVLLPEEIEKIKIEGIPVPEIKELPVFPEKPKKKFLGTIILLLSVAVILIFSLKLLTIDYTYENAIIGFAFFVAIVSLTATVFEILHNGKTKKIYRIAVKLHSELQKEQEEIKAKRSQAIEDNNSSSAIETYRHDAINKYFRYSYNKIQAVQKEHTVAQNRFVVFMEQYFEKNLLENIRIFHEPKELDYSPDFVIKLESPKVNIAIDIEEPYLFDGTKIVVKKKRSEDSFVKRYRVTNELRWVSIVFSEEQIVTHPTEACKLIAHTIDEILLKEKYSDSFKNVDKLKRAEIPGQRELSAFIRNKHREKYLAKAGLIDGLAFDPSQLEFPKKEENTAKKETPVEEKKDIEIIDSVDKSREEKESEKKEIVENKKDTISENKKEKKTSPDKEIILEKKTISEKKDVEKQEQEVEQLQIVKKVTEKLRSEKLETEKSDSIDKEQLKEKEEKKDKVEKIEEVEKQDDIKLKEETKTYKPPSLVPKGHLKREAEIFNKLYSKTVPKKEQLKVETEKDVEPDKENLEKEQVTKDQQDRKNEDLEFIKRERLAKENLENERLEKVQIEKQRLEKEKADQERPEKERLAKEKLAKEQAGQERLEKERLLKEKQAKDHKEKEQAEQERLNKEKAEKERFEKERLAKEKLAKGQKEKEQAEQERLNKEKAEKERLEKERLAKEKLAKE
ncbi:MAG: hypothetical protein DRJ10_05640, partial [Bacteroidetes bacterium]